MIRFKDYFLNDNVFKKYFGQRLKIVTFIELKELYFYNKRRKFKTGI